MDGTALIRFPDGTKRPLPISRLIHLDDGLDPEAQALAAAGLLGPDGEGMEGSEGWMTDDGEGEDEEYELADGGESGEEEEEKDERIEHGPIAKKRKRSRRESRGWADEDDVVTMEGVEGEGDQPAEIQDAAEVPSTTETPTEQEEGKGVSMPSAELDDFADWSRFEVLEDVPKDHHYSNETVQVPSKTFLSRVRKEHGVLASSLPRTFQFFLSLPPLFPQRLSARLYSEYPRSSLRTSTRPPPSSHHRSPRNAFPKRSLPL